MGRPHAPRTRIEKDIVDAEAAVADFADKRPEASVTVLRCANVLGPDVRTAHTALFSLPAVPTILGFDPRYQFVHEDDVVAALSHAVENEIPGIFNVAGDGVLVLSEVIDLLGKPMAPILPPWGTGMAASALRRLGIRIPPEMLNQLRFGRGLDNRKLKAAGMRYRYTTRETVIALGEHMRLDPILRGAQSPYRYEREVEEFLRWSPHVRADAYRKGSRLTGPHVGQLEQLLATDGEGDGEKPAPRPRQTSARARRSAGRSGAPSAARHAAAERSPVDHYDDLEPQEIISLLGSLERDDLLALHRHELASHRRENVLKAIGAALERTPTG